MFSSNNRSCYVAGPGALTEHLFVAGRSRGSESRCVWRVSLDGTEVDKWLPTTTTTTSPYTLFVTSKSNQLLVTSQENNELLLYAVDKTGLVEQKRIPLLNIRELQHAVETSRGTFIVSCMKPKPLVCEVNVGGHVILDRIYSEPQRLSWPIYLSVDSDDRIFVVDRVKHHILVLSSLSGSGERVLLDTQQQLTRPRRLCYTQQTQQTSRQLVVGGGRFLMSGYVQLYSVEHTLSR